MDRADLHALVDSLPEKSVDAAGELLQRAQDPLTAMLDAAPVDDEPWTPDDQEAVDVALREPAIAWSTALAELDD